MASALLLWSGTEGGSIVLLRLAINTSLAVLRPALSLEAFRNVHHPRPQPIDVWHWLYNFMMATLDAADNR